MYLNLLKMLALAATAANAVRMHEGSPAGSDVLMDPMADSSAGSASQDAPSSAGPGTGELVDGSEGAGSPVVAAQVAVTPSGTTKNYTDKCNSTNSVYANNRCAMTFTDSSCGENNVTVLSGDQKTRGIVFQSVFVPRYCNLYVALVRTTRIPYHGF